MAPYPDGTKKRRMWIHSPYGWVSYLHRAATTYYLCCGQALEDSQGAGRIGLTHILVFPKCLYWNTRLCSTVQRLCQRVKRKTCFSVLQRVQPMFANLNVGKVSAYFPFFKAQWQNNLDTWPFCTDKCDILMTKIHFNYRTFWHNNTTLSKLFHFYYKV